MDLENQKRIQTLAEENGAENIVILLGAAEAEAAGLAAETVISGDPTYAGCLAGVELGLTVYHVLEEEFKNSVNADDYEEQIGMMEMVLDGEAIAEEMRNMRKGCKYL